ncbi:MAG: hypothetical protein A2603_10260 [Bdellovibrionales bacterium RIFOXYD1_FULL_55_31]|nr:MAG: hypothetical protein A2603_10260 [Bdellovibrionales bacterium RIFOXYD1_FULL_55_31]
MDSVTDFFTDFLSSSLGAGSELGSILQVSGALLVAYSGGVLSSLTPCVYPVIPITVSVVGGIGEAKRSWREVWVRSVLYVFGMTVVYSFLGVAAGLTGRVFGSLTNSSGWYISLGVIMTVAGLIMMDVITFDPFVFWQGLKLKIGNFLKRSGRRSTCQSNSDAPSRSGQHKREMTLSGVFALGASSGFIAAPCTTPVLTVILAYIAKTQSVVFGFALMFAFSVGLGTILLIVAAFAGAVRLLPRSGTWMKAVKTASGLILLVFAEYLLYRAGTLGG